MNTPPYAALVPLPFKFCKSFFKFGNLHISLFT